MYRVPTDRRRLSAGINIEGNMYLITAYFDDKTNKNIRRWIDGIAKCTGNQFMIEHNVPPHLTITAFDSRGADHIIPIMDRLQTKLNSIDVEFVSTGVFLPYVMYITPVLDKQLHEMASIIHEEVVGDPGSAINGLRISKFYHPDKWFPHTTIGKTLDEEQMRQAFAYMQKSFVPFSGKIVELGLARTNPHEDIVRHDII